MLPSCQRALAVLTLALPICRSLPCSVPSLRTAGQRPLSCTCAFSAPASRAASPAPVPRRHSGCSRFSVGISAFSRQRSAPPWSALPRSASSRRLLPSASSCSCTWPSSWVLLCSARLPWIGTPASWLGASSSRAVPRSWASCCSSAPVGPSAGRPRSKFAWPFRRCGPCRQGESSRPGHQGSGSKSCNAACPRSAQPARRELRLIRPSSLAVAPPACASSSRSSMFSAPSCASSRTCTGCAGPRSSRRPSSRPRSCTCIASGLPPSKPLPSMRKAPSSCMAGARASSSAGRRPCSCVFSCQPAGRQLPWPLIRPAAALAVPRLASKVFNDSSLGSSGRACSSSRSPRSGSRPSFQRPAARLSSCSVTAAGRWAASLRTVASRSSAVTGASPCRAARSSARALACSSPMGQAAKGFSTARASSACAGRCPVPPARSRASSCGAASGPAKVSEACQSPCSRCARSICACSARASRVPTCACALACSWSQSSCRSSMRCSAPSSAPRLRRARRSRTGVSTPSMCSSSMRSSSMSRPSGSSRLRGGSMSVLGSLDRLSSTRPARSSARLMRNHCRSPPACSPGSRQARSCNCSRAPSPGNGSSMRCAEKSPNNAPRVPLICSTGTRCSSQAVPASVVNSQPSVPSTRPSTASTPSR